MLRPRHLVAGALVAAAGSGCVPGTVHVAFRPVVGSELRYSVTVRTNATIRIAGGKPQRKTTEIKLQANQTVLSSDADGSTVRVILTEKPGNPRVLTVRLDRAAQLIGVESADRATLGDLGVAEIFPAAAGAPPNRPLRPGERWHVDSPVTLPQAAASNLAADGLLVRLGASGARRTATIRTTSTLPIVRRTENAAGREAVLEGTQHTTTTTTHDLADGSVADAQAVTNANYALRYLPPDGSSGPPVTGSLALEVRSETTRLY